MRLETKEMREPRRRLEKSIPSKPPEEPQGVLGIQPNKGGRGPPLDQCTVGVSRCSLS